MHGISAVLQVLTVTAVKAVTFQPSPSAESNDLLSDVGMAVIDVLGVVAREKCFPILLQSCSTTHVTVLKNMTEIGVAWGVSVFGVEVDGQDTNMTEAQLSWVVSQARQLRQVSWCVTVVVVSDDPAFLAAFAEWSLKGRLLRWSTRLLVVTRLPREDLRALFASYRTFSMMNTMALHVDLLSNGTPRCSVYTHLPYSPDGAKLVQLATWTSSSGLSTWKKLFPDKFTNFYRATVKVTALPYEPYWMTEGVGNTTKYSGMDYNQLVALSEVLNFTIRVLPSRNWKEVTSQVETRESDMASIVYVILPKRLERWDYTHPFDFSPLSFAMAKPELKPSWLSFYYPVSGEVWVGILISILVCPVVMKITKTEKWQMHQRPAGVSMGLLESVGSLLGQGVYGRLSPGQPIHIVVGVWLFFGVVMSSAYRGSLIASLTLPRTPPRPETLEQLIESVDRVTFESYGVFYKEFFSHSDSTVLRALGELIQLGVKILDGLNTALQERTCHLDKRQYLELLIAEHFIRPDGTTSLYVGRERIYATTAAWPIPHDAPYKHAFDRSLMAVTEAGLYGQWRKEILERTAKESRKKRQEKMAKQLDEEDSLGNAVTRSLTISHMQGPLLLLILGLALATLTFMLEKILATAFL